MSSYRSTVVSVPPRNGRRALIAVLVALAFGFFGALVPAAAASASGEVTVQILDQGGLPVVGLNATIRDSSNTDVTAATPSDGSGVVTFSAVPDGSYYLYVDDGSMDTAGDAYGSSYELVVVAGADVALADLVVNRYVDISGTIDNWTPAMAGGVEVQLWYYGTSTGTSFSVVTTTANFTLPVLIFAQSYTLRFSMYDSNTPYLDAYLGGELDDPLLATELVGVAGVGFSGLTMTMPEAVAINGTVTTGGATPLEGIYITAEDRPAQNQQFQTTTDALGQYTLYVRPGLTYAVYADDYDPIPSGPYASMTYDGWDGCGCDFTPVTPTALVPAQNIDFDLLLASNPIAILGVVIDDSSFSFADNLTVRLFKQSGSNWVLDDVVVSDSTSGGSFNFGYLLAGPGQYRLQFLSSTGVVLSVTNGFVAPLVGGPSALFDPVPACYADLGTIADVYETLVEVDLTTAAGACASLDATIPPPSGGTATNSGRSSSSRVAPAVVTTLVGPKKPTSTPTPTPSATPAPTSTPTAVAAVEPGPADLSWLFWVLGGILLVIILGGVLFIVLRRV